MFSMPRTGCVLLFLLLLLPWQSVSSQVLMCDTSCLAPQCPQVQMRDCNYGAAVATPRYLPCGGPRLLFDSAHNNFHSAECNYNGFRALLKEDGYYFSDGLAGSCPSNPSPLDMILTIVNPRPQNGAPSAFTDEEAQGIAGWVRAGGSLLLVIDHSPMNQIDNLLAEFGLAVCDDGVPTYTFWKTTGELSNDPTFSDSVSAVTTFTGTSVIVESPPSDATYTSVLELPELCSLEKPTPELQGVAITLGAGKVYVSAEAAMFTAQARDRTTGCDFFGMQPAEAAWNEQFLLNIIHWLDPRP